MIGAALSTLGMLPLPFLPSLEYYYIFYGVLAGLFCFKVLYMFFTYYYFDAFISVSETYIGRDLLTLNGLIVGYS